jgi:hypothetical protein
MNKNKKRKQLIILRLPLTSGQQEIYEQLLRCKNFSPNSVFTRESKKKSSAL